ncbi:hypothetical protein GLOTRDRAFT_97238 [Gloeophyllum trabeum ATCC 11539]|uniref:CCHC-type domain-containing protein n=1 Tax=Gloeophyllum trabeum (strain ATCC 11539 / FP-39264 / Madison 617) TaxID=670483 RepID=S7RCH3_GLOTA|nr:uncharacterized protein GLOTRDRAFT_97238 [Gloeophyllum trabeum ATCC 11539]EPQ50089.1 hypothetical protein GLOTRDRAFT_97238 [Gloeophyllum trabeum ATCC 11539]
MSGTASRFFMKHVANHQRDWTVERIFEALFDYCFPIDYKLKLRERLMASHQGSHNVRDFVRDIQSLASRFPDITERQIVQIFWEGVHQYIRLKWIDKGYSPEDTSFKKLVKWAIRFEASNEARRREEREFRGKPKGREWGRFQARTSGNTPHKPAAQAESSNSSNSSNRPSRNEKKAYNNTNRGDRKPRDRSNKISKDERDRLRAEGRCFSCKEAGHESRNCPKRHEAKAPRLGAGSIRFAELETLAKQKHDATIEVSSVIMDSEPGPTMGSGLAPMSRT